MGADSFVAFYGNRYDVGDADAADELNHSTDPRIASAKRSKLDVYVGRLTDGEPYFLLIGRKLGDFGIEGEYEKSFSAVDLAAVAEETQLLLNSCDLIGHPKFWFQLVAQY